MLRLPGDCVLLPVTGGELLLSRGHATFCRVAEADAAAVRRALDGGAVDDLPAEVRTALELHGFFGPPRQPEPARPSVQLQLTNACNLACSYCCTNSGAARKTELDLAGFRRVVDDAREVLGAGARVAILGGEPFLVPWAVDLAEHVLDRELELTVFSNGAPLRDPGLAARVAAIVRRGGGVRVSLAGASRESCDAASGAERFDDAVAGVHELARHGALPTVDVMILPDDVGRLAAALPGLRRALPPGTKVALGVLFHGGRETGVHLFGSRAALEEALDRIAFEAGERIAATPAAATTHRREGCTCALGHHLHVRSDGALFTCFKMEERVGDLRGERFADAVRAVRARPHPARTLPLCRDCALATLCGGGCRAENIQYTGDGDEPVCGPWRVRVLSELLAEDRPAALEWPAEHLLSEARRRGIPAPARLSVARPSLHVIEG